MLYTAFCRCCYTRCSLVPLRWCRFLWRGNFSFAIPRHYLVFDVAQEGENVKMRGKSVNASVDAQVKAYQADGLRPFSIRSKFPIISGKWADLRRLKSALKGLRRLKSVLKVPWHHSCQWPSATPLPCILRIPHSPASSCSCCPVPQGHCPRMHGLTLPDLRTLFTFLLS